MYNISEHDVVYEDNHLIGINKLGGHIVQADETRDITLTEMVKIFLKEKYNKPFDVFLGVIHRLDRPVSGLVLFAKTSKGLDRMNKLFRKREVDKCYIAVVRNEPPKEADVLINWLVRDKDRRITYAYGHEVENSQYAELHYELLGSVDGYYVLKIKLITGRTHQIRAQLGFMGCPIVGDNKYGYPRGSRRRTISLHARSLHFIHPVKKIPIDIYADFPPDGFWDKFDGIMKNSKS